MNSNADYFRKEIENKQGPRTITKFICRDVSMGVGRQEDPRQSVEKELHLGTAREEGEVGRRGRQRTLGRWRHSEG